ncbi:hypothetical protein MYP_671 [Sporocytophaga myxococcoides]|uniref:Uncharacterized protein n=1 Tax=Sporocytophaga myxococcoides TaxID=153721 RepID=A0A098LAH9_9BACT|nr:hypothetical protein [Sporocytophaga myxococcoides]GAL83444.1 hypothetical protein MYP_671 [Sporocytophaga myxococcoides]
MTLFDTKNTCFSYIKGKLFELLAEELQKSSKLELNYRHSKQTKSLYLSLMFKKEYFKKCDPLVGQKFPYVIRVSDHGINIHFSERMADAEIIVRQVLSKDLNEQLNILKSEIKNINLSIFSTTDINKISNLKTLRVQKILECESILAASQYTFKADFDSICSDIKKILKAHE